MPSQTKDQFDNIFQLFERLSGNIVKLKSSFVLIAGDLNYRNSFWYLRDPVRTHGAGVKALTYIYGLHQLTKTTTHLLQISASRTDLVFANQPHRVMESVVHSYLCSMYH